MQSDFLFSVLFAFIGNSLIAVGQSVQKAQVSSIAKTDPAKLKIRRTLVWLLGIFSSNSGLVFIYLAIARGYTTVVGAMNASSLLVLLLIAKLFLKENIRKGEFIAALFILTGTALIPLFPADSVPGYDFSLFWLWAGVVLGLLIFGAALIVAAIKKLRTGLILAGYAGLLTASSQLFQKVANLPEVLGGLSPTAAFLQKWSFIPFLGLSFLALQFAYRREKAVTVIPVFNALVVVIPVWVGFLYFGERLSPLQWAGVGLILVGVGVMNALSVKVEEAE